MVTTITEVLNSWADFGIFAYVLPFLMVFSIVFGILNKSNMLGKNKGVQATISIAIGLLSLQSNYVSNFFANVFPYAGVGIAVLLIALILMGLWTDEKDDWSKYVWFGLGAIIFIVIMFNSFGDLSFFSEGTSFIKGHSDMIIWGIVIAGILIAIIKSMGSSPTG